MRFFRPKPPFARLIKGHPLARDLFCAYTFNGRSPSIIYDYGNNENNSLTNVGSTITNGPWGRAAAFNGSSQYAWRGDTPQFTMGDKLTLVAAWQLNSVVGTGCMIRKEDSEYAIRNVNNQIQGFVQTGGGTTTITGAHTIGTDERYVSAFVYNGVDMRIYLDGLLDATPVAKTGTIVDKTQYLVIGAAANDANITPVALTQFFSGTIHAAYIYKRALTANEVAWISEDPFAMFRRKRIIYKSSAVAPTSKFRRTASRIGTRTGTRQTWVA